MKTKRNTGALRLEPTEDIVREYAHHLYLQSGCTPGRDLENWLEAKACLKACIPKSKTHQRLHHYSLKGGRIADLTLESLEARNLSS